MFLFEVFCTIESLTICKRKASIDSVIVSFSEININKHFSLLVQAELGLETLIIFQAEKE